MVFPACAGMSPIMGVKLDLKPSFPRMRGDEPPRYVMVTVNREFSPHARG